MHIAFLKIAVNSMQLILSYYDKGSCHLQVWV